MIINRHGAFEHEEINVKGKLKKYAIIPYRHHKHRLGWCVAIVYNEFVSHVNVCASTPEEASEKGLKHFQKYGKNYFYQLDPQSKEEKTGK